MKGTVECWLRAKPPPGKVSRAVGSALVRKEWWKRRVGPVSDEGQLAGVP